jgi:uncharacterized membrane protein YgcG
MKLIDFLLANHVPMDVNSYKVHLATVTGQESPLQAYHEGTFKEFQEWQTKQNFSRAHVVSLIALPRRDRWLFAGVFAMHEPVKIREKLFRYSSTLVAESAPWVGRLVIGYKRKARQPYIFGKTEDYDLLEMYEEPLSVEDFSGYNRTCLSYAELKIIVSKERVSWKTALGKVKGVYLITDTHTGKHYVGKADGESGIWQRWCSYVSFGHGGNKELRELLGTNPPEYLEHFQFSILEIADFQSSDLEINARESHWKKVLRTRDHGYNSN